MTLDEHAKRAGLAVLGGVVVAVVALWALPAEAALAVLRHAGYWLILAAVLGFAWALARIAPQWRAALTLTKADYWCGAALALLGVLLLVHEEAGFKILMDEIHLLGTSMAMHYERSVFVPQRAHELNGVFELLAGMVDKRPLLFPLLGSVLHDLLGYRPENLFLLNGVLTFVLLALSYLAGRALGGWRAGLFAALGWAALPLLGQNARGGGFELLHVVMLLATALLGGWYYRQRDERSLTAFVWCAVLLAQVRYESPLFLAPVAALIALVWYEQRAVSCPWPVVLAPVMLFPVPLLMRVFEARPGSWELASKPGHQEVFSIFNVPENLGHAFAYWFNLGVEQPNSPLLAGVGLIALVLCVATVGSVIRGWATVPMAARVTLLFCVGLLVHLVLMLCYFWGKFDEPVIRRLSLPSHLLFIFAALLIVRRLAQPAKGYGALVAVGVVALITSGIPGLARQAATRFYYPAMDTQWRRAFIAARAEKDYLVIDNDSTIWITHQVPATPVIRAKSDPEAFAFNLRNRMFSEMFVFQRFDIDQASGTLTIKPDDELGPAYELETVGERTFTTELLSRLSRVKAIRRTSGERVEAAPIANAEPTTSTQSRDERERAFMTEWIKRLP
ncbi:MAG: hypothetical protein V4773_21795 [Verrucomicrobiota bacterium]